MSLELVVGLILICIGLPMCLRAFRSRSRRIALRRNSVRVEGKVIRFEETLPSQSTISEGVSLNTSSAVVEYRDEKRRRHELMLPEQSFHHFHRVGTKVVVYFERGNPKNATTINGTWDVNLICGLCLTVVLIGAGFLVTVYQKESSKTRSQTEINLFQNRDSQR